MFGSQDRAPGLATFILLAKISFFKVHLLDDRLDDDIDVRITALRSGR